MDNAHLPVVAVQQIDVKATRQSAVIPFLSANAAR